MSRAPRPYNLVAEVTYRCPLRCPYCSNPAGWSRVHDGLDAAAWARVFREAAELGCVHVGLTGGEPSVRRDLPDLVRAAAGADLYVHLVTAGTPLAPDALPALAESGLRSVQLSVQDATAEASDTMAGAESFGAKQAVARAVRACGLPLTLNAVVHRHNLARVADLVALARELDADRLELAHVQYHGHALANRAALLPTRAEVDAAAAVVEAERARSPRPEILVAMPDLHRDRPKPCMGGWGQRTVVVDPAGRVLPCHAAAAIPGLEFWSVTERPLAACWAEAPGMNAFRGEGWMREPCRTCPERARDHGGCRCQAWQLTGDPAATDPACVLSPHHDVVRAARAEAERTSPTLQYRRATFQ